MNSKETGPHLSDAELVRYVDEDGGSHEYAQWKRHVEVCRQCDAAVHRVRDDSRLVSDSLERAAFEAEAPTLSRAAPAPPLRLPRKSAIAPWLRAAALFVLLAAPLAAFPGVRTWVADRLVGPPASMTRDDGATASSDAPTILRFVPAPGSFVVRFEPDGEGIIIIERSTEPEAELRAEGGEPEATVSPSLLRIRNPDSARYRLRLPDATTGVWVMIGERAVAVSQRQIDRRTVVELGSQAPGPPPR